MSILEVLEADGQRFCWRFPVAISHEGRTIYGLRIHRGRGGRKRGVLIVGGAHAREMVPPEAVLLFAWRLCRAYALGSAFSFGGKTYPPGIVAFLVEGLELFVVPLLNVDGRAWVETTDQMWRKNRRPDTISSCVGVDLNRNYDFLFASGIGTSSQPCNYDVYRGPSAHSEAEVRGIRDLLDLHHNIRGVLDVHSFRGVILYPWGDDENQSSNASMTFTNPVWDGQRGIKGDAYKEHIVTKDWNWYTATAQRMRDRVKEVAGRTYAAQQSVDLYQVGISAVLNDYAYSRNRVDLSRPKILSMAVEIGFAGDGEFRTTPGSVAQTVRNEGVVLIVEFCLAIICVGDVVLSSTGAAAGAAASLRSFREQLLQKPAGRRYVEWFDLLGGEAALRLAEPKVVRELPTLLKAFHSWWKAEDEPLGQELAERCVRVLRTVRRRGSREFAKAIDAALSDLERMRNRSAKAMMSVIRAGVPTKRTRRRRTRR
jgi:murein tripeptide amidase MpaA